MNGINIIGLTALVVGVILCGIIYHISRRYSVGKRLCMLIASGILSIPCVLVAGYYLGVPLEHGWFYEMRSWRGSEFLVLPASIAAGVCATFLPRLCFPIPLLGLLGIGIVPYLKPLIMPLSDAEFQETWKNGICLQSTSSTCGPASIATLLRRHGISATENEIARNAHTYRNGTEAWYLARYVRSRGMRATFDFRDGFSPDAKFPALVGVKLGKIGHFIPVLSVEGDTVIIADPLRGEERLSLEEIHKRYGFTGFHLVIDHP